MRTMLRDKPEIELLDGQRYPKVSPKRTHSLVQGNVLVTLMRCAANRGEAGPEWRCHPGAGSEFVPDVSYYSYERLHSLSADQREEPPFAPDIAVEVRSPSHRKAYDAQKFAAYLDHGTTLVLEIDPASRTVYAHARGADVRPFVEPQTFEHENVPWLRFEVAELFARLNPPAR